jgi:hypothetical protein
MLIYILGIWGLLVLQVGISIKILPPDEEDIDSVPYVDLNLFIQANYYK